VSAAYAINERGQVVGSSDGTAALWQDGAVVDLGTLPGYLWSYGSAINDRGQVVGWSGAAESPDHAVLWENGKITDLRTLPGNWTDGAATTADARPAVGSRERRSP
jgi:probable HAF family extracellular repeat protein